MNKTEEHSDQWNVRQLGNEKYTSDTATYYPTDGVLRISSYRLKREQVVELLDFIKEQYGEEIFYGIRVADEWGRY